jgi:hypothetical protein
LSFSDSTRSAAPQTSSKAPSSQDHPVFTEFWEAPARFSKPALRYLAQVEIDAILVSIPIRDLIHYSWSCRVGELLYRNK